MSGEQRAEPAAVPAEHDDGLQRPGEATLEQRRTAPGDYPHHVLLGTKAPDPTLSRALAAAQRIAGAGWHAWWYDHGCAVAVIGFRSDEHARRFGAWIAAQRC